MALLNFDSSTIAPTQSYDPLVPGDYLAMITASEEKRTNAGNGSYIALTFQVIEGQYDGRKIWANLNLDNPNAKAVEIAQRDLSAICHAVGHLTVQDSEELHDKPMIITVGYEMDKNTKQPALDANGKPRNRISAYKKADGSAVANHTFSTPKPAAQAQAPAAAPAKPAAPWARKAA